MPIFRPIWPPSGSKSCLPSKINLNFSGFFHTFLRKRARRCQLRRVISQQPLRIETKGSPFWKLGKQGFNTMLQPRKSKIWPWTHPYGLNFRDRQQNLPNREVLPEKLPTNKAHIIHPKFRIETGQELPNIDEKQPTKIGHKGPETHSTEGRKRPRSEANWWKITKIGQKWTYSYSKQGEEVIIFHYDKSD